MDGSNNLTINAKDYKRCLNYIEKYWKKITCHVPHDHSKQLGVPHPYISPNNGIFKDDLFYWDSFFTILGLVKCDRVELAKGMVDDLLSLQQRFNIIPMRNRYYNLGSSQIPFLTSMISEVFNITKDSKWYRSVMKAAEHELHDYWMNKKLTEIHIVYMGLSRYCNHFITHLAAEHESGWDMTSRFKDHCLNILPVDLNSCLYKYETDLADFYKLIKNTKKHRYYLLAAEKRRKKINELMWNFNKGFYFDFDYKLKKRNRFYSIAGFYPLWAKMATPVQAKRVCENLKRFEYVGGLANTQSKGLSKEYKQHDYPNGWPQQQWIVIKGLMNYGFESDARRLAKKFLDLNNTIFKKTGKLWEKYDVVKCTTGQSERYDTQPGFAWTNAIFIRLLDKFSNK
jgi:alpha,alpha-trehalase